MIKRAIWKSARDTRLMGKSGVKEDGIFAGFSICETVEQNGKKRAKTIYWLKRMLVDLLRQVDTCYGRRIPVST